MLTSSNERLLRDWSLMAVALPAILSVGCSSWPVWPLAGGGTDDGLADMCRQQNVSPSARDDAHLGCDEVDDGVTWAENLTIYRVDTEATTALAEKFREEEEAPVEIRYWPTKPNVMHPDLQKLREAVEPAVDDEHRVVYRYVFENEAAPEGPNSGGKPGDESGNDEPLDIEPGEGLWHAMLAVRDEKVALDEVRSVELEEGFQGRRAKVAVELGEAAGDSFEEFTRRHTRENMAIVYDETFVISAPEIYEPISAGRLQLPTPVGPGRALPRLPEAAD